MYNLANMTNVNNHQNFKPLNISITFLQFFFSTFLLLIRMYQIFSLSLDWSKRISLLNVPDKTREYPSDIIEFLKLRVLRK